MNTKNKTYNSSTELTQEEENLMNARYSNSINWSSKTPKTFKVSLNLKIMKMKKLYYKCNTGNDLY